MKIELHKWYLSHAKDAVYITGVEPFSGRFVGICYLDGKNSGIVLIDSDGKNDGNMQFLVDNLNEREVIGLNHVKALTVFGDVDKFFDVKCMVMTKNSSNNDMIFPAKIAGILKSSSVIQVGVVTDISYNIVWYNHDMVFVDPKNIG